MPSIGGPARYQHALNCKPGTEHLYATRVTSCSRSWILARYIRADAHLALTDVCRDGREAQAALLRHTVGVIFLDIRMRDLDGLTLLRHVREAPAVVFVTAHSEHAIEAFDLQAVEHLLKPVSRERFNRAVDRVLARNDTDRSTKACIYVRIDEGLTSMPVADIAFVEACENHVRIHTTRKHYLTKAKMASMQDTLTPEGYVRVHCFPPRECAAHRGSASRGRSRRRARNPGQQECTKAAQDCTGRNHRIRIETPFHLG